MTAGEDRTPAPPDPAQLMVIRELPGYSPQIGRLVCWMHYIRQTTLDAVRGLNVDELDHLIHPHANSIAMLLAHMAALEKVFHIYTFKGRTPSAGFMAEWGTALNLGDRARAEIKGRPLDHYLGRLGEVRESTLAELARRDDAWFARVGPWDATSVANNAFAWHHVVEDEIHHRGQIRQILGMARSAGAASSHS